MPTLTNLRHEAFAQARAKGARLDEAFEAAGFVLIRGHSSRLARRPDVAERIAELRELKPGPKIATPVVVINALLHLAHAGIRAANPGIVREARLALLDAGRLQEEWDARGGEDRVRIIQESECVKRRLVDLEPAQSE
jgi:hypothetical protein